MLNAVLITSFILLVIGCIGLVQRYNDLIKNIISIEIITIASILNILSYKQHQNKTSILLLIIILIISELHLSVLFIINKKIKELNI